MAESKPRLYHLTSIEDVRRLLSSTINQVRRQKIGTEQARVIGYLANTILKAIETGKLEDRLAALEALLVKPGE